jgi:SAM-dependent methyltransferase
MNDYHSLRERNIAAFDADTAVHGGYVYTAVDRWSSRYATGRQTDEPPSVRVVDIGCGDGTFTLEIAERFRPSAVRGIDPAGNAVAAARARMPHLAIVRGVLHHLDRAKDAIAQLARQFTSVIALEPNGYNPGLKIIEKMSRYHRQHDEKSYWPPALNRWFEQAGFSVVAQRFLCLVPYFCPTAAAKILGFVEPAVESLPLARHVACGTNLVLYRRMQ